MRRPTALAAAALAVWAAAGGAAPAAAHAPARLVVTSPAEGARLTGETVRVVVTGVGGSAPAAFRLDLDGQTVDATGRIGGVFSTLSVEPGGRLTLDVRVPPGEHTLTATPNFDPDSKQVTVVRRFTVVAPATPSAEPSPRGAGGVPVVPLAAGGVVVALGVVLLLRRRAVRAPAEPTV